MRTRFRHEKTEMHAALESAKMLAVERGTPERNTMAKKKTDPLNKKHYGAVTAMLTVSDVAAAASFYQKAFGFTKRGIMNGPDGKPMHAELTLRGATLMLGPENPEWGTRSAKSVGASPAGLSSYVQNLYQIAPQYLSI